MLKKYIGTKVVWAEPAVRITDAWGKKTVETLASNPVIQQTCHLEEGYKVVYRDGYESFSPRKVFEESYHEIPVPKPGQQKAMLSQPMAGKTQEEIVAARELAVAVLEDAGYHVVNTLFTDEWYKRDAMKERGVEQIPLQFLAKSLESMSLCHCAYFCKGWEETRGCRIEHQAAIEYGLDIIYEE